MSRHQKLCQMTAKNKKIALLTPTAVTTGIQFLNMVSYFPISEWTLGFRYGNFFLPWIEKTVAAYRNNNSSCSIGMKKGLKLYVEGFHKVWYKGGVKATVSGVVEDLKFKISEGSDPN